MVKKLTKNQQINNKKLEQIVKKVMDEYAPVLKRIAEN